MKIKFLCLYVYLFSYRHGKKQRQKKRVPILCLNDGSKGVKKGQNISKIAKNLTYTNIQGRLVSIHHFFLLLRGTKHLIL